MQIKISTNKFSIRWLRGVHVSSIVNELVKTISSLFIIFFLRKNVKRTKTQIKQKPTNKIKTSEQKIAKATVFCAQKLLRGEESLVFRFLKNWNCLDNLIYYNTLLVVITGDVLKSCILAKNVTFVWSLMFRCTKDNFKVDWCLTYWFLGLKDYSFWFEDPIQKKKKKKFIRYTHLLQKNFYDNSGTYILLNIFQIRNTIKLIIRNIARRVTRHHLRHLCSQKFEGYQRNML